MARPQEFNTSEVLHSAMEVFWRNGYEATSMKDLMTAMGLSKSSLYGTFGSKHGLFLAAFDWYRRERTQEMKVILSESTARTAIEIMFRKMVMDVSEGCPSHGCMSINQAVELAPHDSEVRTRVIDDFSSIKESLTQTIIRGQSEGSIGNTEDANKIARLLVIAFPGLQVMRRAGLPTEDIDDAIQLLMSSLD